MITTLVVGVSLLANLAVFLFLRQSPTPLSGSTTPTSQTNGYHRGGDQALPTALVTDAPLPSAPADTEVTTRLASVELKTWNPVTITGIESGTNLYFLAKNTGDQAVTLAVPLLGEPGAIDIPQTLSIKHFFGFQDREVWLAPGAEATIEYVLAPERDGQGVLPFTFQIKETGAEAVIPITVSVSAQLPSSLASTSTIAGTVTNQSDESIGSAEVRLHSFSGRQTWRGQTDEHGRFSFTIPSLTDFQTVLGPRRLPYHDVAYFVTAETAAGGFAYRGGLAPTRGETVTVTLKLTTPAPMAYHENSKFETDGAYGYWWLLPNHDFTQLIATQGRHTPLTEKQPGHLVSISRAGQKLWEVATETSCWGLAVTGAGESVAGCTGPNGSIKRIGSDGTTLWTITGSGENRSVAFSPDGLSILTGPVRVSSGPDGRADAALLDAATGTVRWSYAGADQWLRQARFSRDGERIMAGFSGGRLVMFDKRGQELWQQRTGEFPLVLEIDDDYNVYASGKNRELASFDQAGILRWRFRIPEHVVTAGSNNMSSDGHLIVVGTVGGWLHAFRSDGSVAWKRQLPPLAQGHNALDMTPDGQFILVGTNGEKGGYLVVYRADGSLAWQTQLADRRPPTINRGDHNDTGVMTTAIADDGAWIAAGTGDSTIRIFARK